MTEIVQAKASPVVDYMARDYESLLKAMYDRVPSLLPQWKDFTNEADFGNVMLQLFAHVGDILSYYQDRVANESFLGTARTRRSVIEHLRLIGYTLGTAAPASASLGVVVPGDTNDVVTINQGDAFATKSQKSKPSVRFEYTRKEALVIDFSTIKAKSGKKSFDGLAVEEGRRIDGEVLGTSNGSPNQRFVLARTGLILRPIVTGERAGPDILLQTTLGAAILPWNLQETLAFSRAGQPDYVIEIDEDDRATVLFGDGSFGKIPDSGSVIQATYRVGGGAAGNVPAGSIQTIVGAPQLAQLGASITNPKPATGGADRESIEKAVQHAPAVFRSLKRAVTTADYEALARSVPGVGKAQASGTGWNTVTVYVAPEGGGKVSDTLEAALKDFFEDKRLVSQIVEIQDVDYVPIFVTAEIGIESYYVRSDVQVRVQHAAAALLAFDNVFFGQTIYLSKFYEVIESIAGVLFVNVTEFRRPDQPPPSSGKIELTANEVPVPPSDPAYANSVRVVVTNQGGT